MFVNSPNDANFLHSVLDIVVILRSCDHFWCLSYKRSDFAPQTASIYVVIESIFVTFFKFFQIRSDNEVDFEDDFFSHNFYTSNGTFIELNHIAEFFIEDLVFQWVLEQLVDFVVFDIYWTLHLIFDYFGLFF